MGIVAIVFAFVPFAGAFIAIPCAVVGLSLSVVGYNRNEEAGEGKGMAIAGIVTCIVGVISAILWHGYVLFIAGAD